MNIGISTSVVQHGKSGVAHYVLALVRALLPQTAQHQFTLFVLEEDLPLFAFAESAMKLAPVPERFRPALKNIGWHQMALPQLARDRRLEVLHVPSYRRMLWPQPCALVATIHDLAPFHLAGKYDRLRMFYGRVVARKLAQRQDQIITVSRTTAEDVLGFFGIAEERLSVIPNGVDHARFFPGPHAAARTRVAESRGLRVPFFLYVARLEHPGKNHVRLIEAFNRFKAETGSEWQLALAGSDWHGAKVIHAAIQASPFVRDIHCLGFVPDADLPEWYRAAGVFVYPSLFEGFGLPPAEAMACGCPVISSTRGALGEVVGDAAATVNPEDTGALRLQMTRLATDEGLREQLGAAGLKQARRFDWQTTAAATLEVYARAAAQKAKTRSLQIALAAFKQPGNR
ncbi:MAG TPA: glycosyltransferase family 1 protein [Verrucomicrobiae bacterium]|nr:glycosyltransferase family 1 protein [Verrucomicrobiae bacterium]